MKKQLLFSGFSASSVVVLFDFRATHVFFVNTYNTIKFYVILQSNCRIA